MHEEIGSSLNLVKSEGVSGIRYEAFLPYIEALTCLVILLLLGQSLSTIDDETAKNKLKADSNEKITANISLPEGAKEAPHNKVSKEDLIVTMKPQAGAIGLYYGSKRLSIEDFQKLIKNKRPPKIVLRADKQLRIGKILTVLLAAQKEKLPVSLAYIGE